MEFLRIVEEELRGLAYEARRRHSEVEEASESAIVKLRNMREEYAAAIRKHGGEAPPLTMFRSQDLLRPFLLACCHSDASPRLIMMALGSTQYLINRDAILPSDAPNILRVLAIQSQSEEADVQLRVLQTMVMVVTWKSCHMNEDTVAQALGVCLSLHDARNTTVRNAANMTVKQVISLLFDRAAEELESIMVSTDALADTEGDTPDVRGDSRARVSVHSPTSALPGTHGMDAGTDDASPGGAAKKEKNDRKYDDGGSPGMGSRGSAIVPPPTHHGAAEETAGEG
ncbi:unnamed protein product, partial [Discosporangium mesarthrocarpum]